MVLAKKTMVSTHFGQTLISDGHDTEEIHTRNRAHKFYQSKFFPSKQTLILFKQFSYVVVKTTDSMSRK